MAIGTSLEWFIKMADEGKNSAWINDNETSSNILTKAKELQSQLNSEKSKKLTRCYMFKDRLVKFKIGEFELGRCDKRAAQWMHKHGQVFLRYSLAIVFIWLGALKPLGFSPVNDLVTNTVFWLPSEIFIPFLGYWEIIIGVCLIVKPFIRIALTLLFLQLFGTVLPLAIVPDVCFKDFPFILTLEGQYIIKNIIILSAAIVVGGGLSKNSSEYAGTA